MERHTAQAGNQPVAAAEEARRATRGRVWATFMMVVGSVKEAWHKIDGGGHVGTLVLLLGNEDLGNAVGGRRVNLKDFGTCGVPHGVVCFEPPMALRTGGEFTTIGTERG